MQGHEKWLNASRSIFSQIQSSSSKDTQHECQAVLVKLRIQNGSVGRASNNCSDAKSVKDLQRILHENVLSCSIDMRTT